MSDQTNRILPGQDETLEGKFAEAEDNERAFETFRELRDLLSDEQVEPTAAAVDETPDAAPEPAPAETAPSLSDAAGTSQEGIDRAIGQALEFRDAEGAVSFGEGFTNFIRGRAEEFGDVAVQGVTGVGVGLLGVADTALSVTQIATKLNPATNFEPVAFGLSESREFLQDTRTKLSESSEAETAAGGIARGLAQFGVGFAVLSPLKAASVPRLASQGAARVGALIGPRAAAAAEKGTAGAITGLGAELLTFDPYEARVSNWLNDTFLANPVTEFLAADPEDSEAEARFKQAIEGALFGMGVEGVLAGARAAQFGRRFREVLAAFGLADDPAAAEALRAAQDVRMARAQVADAKRTTGLLAAGAPDEASKQQVLSAAKTLNADAKGLRDVAVERGDEIIESASAGLPAPAQRMLKAYVDNTPNRLSFDARRSLSQMGPSRDQAEALRVAIRENDMDAGVAALKEDFNAAIMDGPEETLAAMGRVAKTARKLVQQETGGVRTFEQSFEFIGEIAERSPEDVFTDLANINASTKMAGETLMVGEMMVRSASTKLDEMARNLDTYKTNQMPAKEVAEFLQLHASTAALHAQLKGAQTNIARGLGLRRLRKGFGDKDIPAELLENVIGDEGGREGAARLIKQIKSANGDPKEIMKAASLADRLIQGAATAGNFLTRLRVESMLSAPLTHFKNWGGNQSMVLVDAVEGAVEFGARQRDAGRPLPRGAVAGDAIASIMPLIQVPVLALKAFARAARFGGRQDARARELGQQALEQSGLAAAIRTFKTGESGAITAPIDPRGRLGQLTDMGEGFLAAREAVKEVSLKTQALEGLQGLERWLPTGWLQAGDAMFMDIAFYAEEFRFLYRKGIDEGLSAAEALRATLKRDTASLSGPEQRQIMQNALDNGRKRTFQDPLDGRLSEKLQEATQAYPGLRLIFPFQTTPANIFKYFHEATPGINLTTRKFWRMLRDPKSQREFQARMKVGGAMTMIFGVAALNGRLQGSYPKNEREREALIARNIPEGSVRVGDRWIQINQIDPLGGHAIIAADIAQHLDELPEEDAFTIVNALAVSMINAMNSKGYLSGATQFSDALSDPDNKMTAFNRNVAKSFFPALLKFAVEEGDDFQRDSRVLERQGGDIAELRRLWNEIAGRTLPGYAEDKMPPKFNVLGPVPRSRVLGLPVGQETPDPLVDAMIENGVNPSLRRKMTSIRGIGLTADERTEFGELITQKKRGGMTLSERMRALVTSPQWEQLTPNEGDEAGTRRIELEKIIDFYVDQARREMLAKPELQAALRERLTNRAEVRSGKAADPASLSDNDSLNAILEVLQ